MDLPVNVMASYGVGRRGLDDIFMKTNKILAEMSERLEVYEIDVDDDLNAASKIVCPVPSCKAEFDSASDSTAHYNAVHRYTCCECKKNLPTSHLLDLHVAEYHDSFFAAMAEKKPSYACYVETCTVKCQIPEERKNHCIKDHKFPPNFRFDQKKPLGPKKLNKSNESNESTRFNFSNSKIKSFSDTKPRKSKNPIEDKSTSSTSKLESDSLMMEIKECLPDT